MRRPAQPVHPQLDSDTLRYAADLLTDRLRAVETYGAGGCASCHDAELRGAIAKLRQLAGTKES